MDEFAKSHRMSPYRDLQAVAYLLSYCMLASGSLAGILYGLGLTTRLPLWAVIVLAPAFYFAWLLLFLGWGCALGVPLYKWIHRRPRRASTADGPAAMQTIVREGALHLKCLMIQSLPMAMSLQALPLWQQLVFRSYAPKNRIGRNVRVWGVIWDPDLTEIGDDSIIGGHTHLSCHAATAQPDGSFVYARAPITIGRRTTIGADCRIALGAVIGDDVILEPGSDVPAFAKIGSGEIWGGVPARFMRKRFDADSDATNHVVEQGNPASEVGSNDSERREAVRRLVAQALDLDLQKIGSDAGTKTIAAWDSLGQMSIAAAIHSRYGIDVGAAETFCLRTITDIEQFLERSQGASPTAPELAIDILPHDPELLPLCDHEQATRALAQQADKLPQPGGEELRVVIAATFTAEAVAVSLKLWARALGLPVRVEFAGYNQVVHELLSPGSLFHENRTGLNVVLARPEDLLAGNHAGSAEALLDAISKFSQEANGTLVVGTIPAVVSKLVTLDRSRVEQLRSTWRQRIGELPEAAVLEFAGVVEDIGIAAAGQADHEIIARSPYSASVYRELGIQLARLARMRRVAPAKVVALDADGVLWGGVIAEDGLQGIQLGQDHPGRSFQLFQQYVSTLKANGQLLVLVSRNQPEDVWKVFDQHPEMILRREDFAGFRINWQPKSQNLKELARELNLGLDAFVFIDDDRANRLEMEANAPGVTVIPLPEDPTQFIPVVSKLWRFDVPHLTAEDRSRTLMMQQGLERQRACEATADFATYLRTLSLRVTMRPASEVDMPRVAQLTQKTNQFNLSLKRRSISELKSLDQRFEISVIEASDRFGDHGLIGVCILEHPEKQGAAFRLDTLLMSCRVLGRGVEEATLHGLANVVRAAGSSVLVAPFVEGPRNQPLAEFLQRTGFLRQDDSQFAIHVSADIACPQHIDWNQSRVADPLVPNVNVIELGEAA